MRPLGWVLLTLMLPSAFPQFVRAAVPDVPQVIPSQPPSEASSLRVPDRDARRPLVVPVRIVGWSTSSETGSSTMRTGPQAVLEASHPELVTFFAASSGAIDPIFRYRLDDYDTDWTETRAQLAHYRRLPPGRYRFEVQARAPDGGWTTATAVLEVVQKPFFYQTWYSYVLVGLIVLVVAAQLLRQHEQILRGQMGVLMEERNRIASDCHDTLMAGLAAVSWQLEATAKLFRSDRSGSTPAAEACGLARSMVAHCQAEARRIIWDLRTTTTITTSLSEALVEALRAHRHPESISTAVEVHGLEIPIAPAAVHHLICIGQEAVSNAIRHSRSNLIRVDLRYEEDSLSLCIRDNGEGFHPSDQIARTGHFGLSVMEERARKLGGDFRIASTPSSGTEVSVKVSFHKIRQPSVSQQVVQWIGL
jgi:signal transduction histidine kinase